MAEEAAVEHAAKGFDPAFLKQKIGPLPLWVWLVVAAAIWWYFTRGSSSLTGSSSTTDTTGAVDPITGESYAQELGAAEDQLSTQAAGQTGTAGGYADNNAWARAAVDYLVGTGVDPTQANEAIQQYLASATLTTQQQADVNLAIQAIGSPPDLPGPVGTPPGPVTTPPGAGGGTTPTPPGAGKPTKAPTGLKSSQVSDTGARLAWSAVTGATGYRVRVWRGNSILADKKVTGPNDAVAGLKPGLLYGWHVAATNTGGQGPYSATAHFTTKKK